MTQEEQDKAIAEHELYMIKLEQEIADSKKRAENKTYRQTNFRERESQLLPTDPNMRNYG